MTKRAARSSTALLIALLSATPVLAGPALRSTLEAVLATQATAWNRGDLEAFTAVYSEDATFLSPSGLARGRAAVLARYRRRYPDRKAMGRLTLDILEVRAAPGPDAVRAASVAARWTLRFPDDPSREPATGLTLLVLHLTADGWRIVQDASM